MGEQLQYPEPPERLSRGRWWRMLAFFGPGAIMASVTIGSGETVFASRAGATFGYAILWCLLLGAIMKAVQVYGGMRFMVLTGHHPVESWGHLPGPRGWCPALIGVISVICFPFWIAGLGMMLGTVSSWILDINVEDPAKAALYARFWVTLYIAIGVSFALLQTYGFLEKVELVIVGLLLLCLLVATIVSRPDWGAALVGAIVPRVPEYADWVKTTSPDLYERPVWVEMLTIVGAVGGGTYDYVGYLGMIREKAWGMLGRGPVGLPATTGAKVVLPDSTDEVVKARTWLRAPLVDCSISFGAVLVFSATFLLLGATILHDQQSIPDGWELLKPQVAFLTTIHANLKYVYQLGIFMAFFGTVIAAYEVNTRTTVECLWAISDRMKRFSLSRTRVVVVLYCGLGGLLLAWVPFLLKIYFDKVGIELRAIEVLQKPVGLVTLPALLGGVFACGLWCFAVLWAEERFLPYVYRMKRAATVATIIAGILLTSSGLIGLWKWFIG